MGHVGVKVESGRVAAADGSDLRGPAVVEAASYLFLINSVDGKTTTESNLITLPPKNQHLGLKKRYDMILVLAYVFKDFLVSSNISLEN